MRTSIDISELTLTILMMLCIGAALYFTVRFTFKFVDNKLTNSPFQPAVKAIRRILKALIILITAIAILSQFLSVRYYSIVENNMKYIISIGTILILTFLFEAIVNSLFSSFIEKIKRRDGDFTRYYFFRSIATITIYSLGAVFIMFQFPSLQNIAKSLLSGAGILAVVIGFAAQESFSNLIAGILIIFSKPFKIGDMIKISDTMMGTVWDISLRHTVIKNFDNNMIVVPNSIINKEKLFNYDLGDSRVCERIEFGIDYTADIDLAKQILAEVVEEHELSIDIRTNYDKETGVPRVVTSTIRLDDSSVIVRVWAWSHDFNSAFKLRCDIIEIVKKRFDAAGIDIPFPHRTIVFKDMDGLKELTQINTNTNNHSQSISNDH